MYVEPFHWCCLGSKRPRKPPLSRSLILNWLCMGPYIAEQHLLLSTLSLACSGWVMLSWKHYWKYWGQSIKKEEIWTFLGKCTMISLKGIRAWERIKKNEICYKKKGITEGMKHSPSMLEIDAKGKGKVYLPHLPYLEAWKNGLLLQQNEVK